MSCKSKVCIRRPIVLTTRDLLSLSVPPFLSNDGSRTQLKSPPIISSLLLMQSSFNSKFLIWRRKLVWHLALLGAYRFSSLKGESSIRMSRYMNLPSLHVLTVLMSKFSLDLKQIATPLECRVPWEKISLPPHSFFHMFSTSGVLYVSCRKIMSALWWWSQVKIFLLFLASFNPRTFKDRREHLNWSDNPTVLVIV